MISLARFVGLLAGISATLFLVGLIGFKGGGAWVMLFIVAGIILYGFAGYGYLHYRAVRQEELRDVLAVAAQTHSPLAIAVWAYVEDRPRGPLRRFCEGAFTNLLVMGSYWSLHKQRRFDRRVAELASNLEAGVPLSHALCMSPGTATRETIMAAAVGESTGDLAASLKQIGSARVNSTMIELVPKLVYPLFLLFCQILVVSFLIINVLPRLERIMSEFRVAMPAGVGAFLGFAEKFLGPIVAMTLLGSFWLILMLIVSPSTRWRLPGVSSIERRYVQGQVLKMLGMLLKAGKTAPEALSILRREEFLGAPAHQRLKTISARIDQGQPLADELAAQGLMPKNMLPLLHAAQRARHFPWALEEAGDTLIRAAMRLVHRVSAIVGPLAIAIMGLLVALTALGVFIPFIAILTKFSPG
jgi:type IV pilus assembly protein PilC